jgi:hypothetical protein
MSKDKGKSYYIQFGIHLNSRLGIKSVTIDHNDTDLASDSDLVRRVSFTLLRSIELNKDDIMLQDLLNGLGLKITSG